MGEGQLRRRSHCDQRMRWALAVMRANPSRYPYCCLNTTELCPIRDPPFIVSPCRADCLHDCPVLPSISTCITCLIRNRVREAPARRREKVLGKKRDNSPTYQHLPDRDPAHRHTNVFPTATQPAPPNTFSRDIGSGPKAARPPA